jgi:hypothetical protein
MTLCTPTNYRQERRDLAAMRVASSVGSDRSDVLDARQALSTHSKVPCFGSFALVRRSRLQLELMASQ